ncbi:wall-associated receptor kinase-like 3 [Salvia splendens]|uniref:wall-associated receptor kinase-like 3 n=1 Tax=Salvia splendens TaxID=180675 RepID=UPI0011026EC1|nr:wall-associated receptor kinase-like 3 [Salvia splendens]
MFPSILVFISFLCLTTTKSQEISWTINKDCQTKCGNVTIPYPFGVGPGCSFNASFTITCNTTTTTTPERPFLSSINLEVLNISVHGVVIVNQPVSPVNCSADRRLESMPMSLQGSPFTISPRYNTLAVLGCTNAVWITTSSGTATVGGCMSICEANSNSNSSSSSSCDGLNCCKATIPAGLKSFQFSYRSIQSNNEFCGYAFPVYQKWFRQDYTRYRGLQINQSYPYDQNFVSAPLVLEWELDIPAIDDSLVVCKLAANYRYPTSSDEYTDPSTSFYLSNYYNEYAYGYISSTKYCSCQDGYQGNPYVFQGCIDIDECALNETRTYGNVTRNYYCSTGTCINKIGSYTCRYADNDASTKPKIALITIGAVLGGLLLALAGWKAARAIRKKIKDKRRQEFFKRNGGLLLQQQLSSTDNSLDKTKVFTYKELSKATDNYNENRVLGRGGQGTVYKGMLTDGKIVAVKKSKMVEEGDLQDFINEIVILSQINHRNVVKLLGCCLETEVPLLVYEFINNGTLFGHIHDPSEDFPLSWEFRLRIGREVAGAIAYLHSAASAPIYHRDIKSTNILLDDKYRAKVSDFGASRTISIDQTHVTTRVLGTFGYLDPEYFQSSQYTEKSDVYSFGVVMVELLTGEKAISSIRAEAGRSLATQFLDLMEEDQVFDIIDERVVREGKREEIMAVAQLAKRCLHLNGKRRPTMYEVAAELEGIRMVKLREETELQQNEDCGKESEAIEVDEMYEDFSSITGSMRFDSSSITVDDDRRLLGS